MQHILQTLLSLLKPLPDAQFSSNIYMSIVKISHYSLVYHYVRKTGKEQKH